VTRMTVPPVGNPPASTMALIVSRAVAPLLRSHEVAACLEMANREVFADFASASAQFLLIQGTLVVGLSQLGVPLSS